MLLLTACCAAALPGGGAAAAAVSGAAAAGVPAGAAANLPPGGAARRPQLPPLHGRAAAIYSVNNRRFIWSRNGGERLPMASLTKIMTALVALSAEHDLTSTPMVIPRAASRVGGEIAYLTPGQTFTFGNLLKAMLIESANDAAVAIAIDVAGSVPAFVAIMNAEARRLGLHNTHFANPDGLNAPGHYSSADDLARLAAVAMANPVFRSIVAMRHATIPWYSRHAVRVLDNHNYLLGVFPGANGVKIGYTSEALNCVVGSAVSGGQEVIAVDMGELPIWEWRDESALLRYGLAVAPTLRPLPAPVRVSRPTEAAGVGPHAPGGAGAPGAAARPRGPVAGRDIWIAGALCLPALWLWRRAVLRRARRRRLQRRRVLGAGR